VTPKYWVVYNHQTKDVLSWTMHKCRYKAEHTMDVMLYGDWREDSKFEVILVEIIRVEI